MIALVVRDPTWRTLPPASLRVRQSTEGWSIHGRTRIDAAMLHWRVRVTGASTGLDVRARLRAEGDVLTNRAGLVVLLPAAVYAHARFQIQRPDGKRSRGALLRDIAPHQPMTDVATVDLAVPQGPRLRLAFEGGTFEMEDQRNWLDPTYKLYSPPLSQAAPYRILDGELVEQRVRIDVQGRCRPRRTTGSPRRGRAPAIGLTTAPGRVPEDPATLAALREVAPAYLLHRTDGRARGVSAAARVAARLDADLRLETFGDGRPLAETIRRVQPAVVSAYRPGPLIERALAETRTPVTAGTFADFVMLNRHGVAASASSVVFGLCPTVHARDDRSLIETLDAMPMVFARAARIANGCPLEVGPCALRRRLSPRTGQPDVQPLPGERVAYDVDPRQYSEIAAAWLAAVVAVAASEGVTSVCAFEAAGARGIVRSRSSARRDGQGIERSPVHAVLAAFASHADASLTLYDLHPFRGAAFTIGPAERTELWLVDLSGTRRTVPRSISRLAWPLHIARGTGGAHWSPLRSANLAPYGMARVVVGCDRRVAAVARSWCRDGGGEDE